MPARPFEGVIMDTVTNEKVLFHSFDPPSFVRQVVYQDEHIRGRSKPHTFYGYTEAKAWSFRLRIIASVDQNDNGDTRTVMERVNFIDSLSLPDYGKDPGVSSAMINPPHLALIQIASPGGLFMKDIGTIRNFSCQYHEPYDVNTGMPQMAEVSFNLNVAGERNSRPEGYADVRRLLIRGQTRVVY